MSPSKIKLVVVAERTAWVREMLSNIRSLPLESMERFTGEKMHVAAAESYLRRALEAVMDIGRHILAKGFAIAAGEYKSIGAGLCQCGVIDGNTEKLFSDLAGYRNRMVHFYHEITDEELYSICTARLDDVYCIVDTINRWIESHPEMIDKTL